MYKGVAKGGGSWGACEPPFCKPFLSKQPTTGGENGGGCNDNPANIKVSLIVVCLFVFVFNARNTGSGHGKCEITEKYSIADTQNLLIQKQHL